MKFDSPEDTLRYVKELSAARREGAAEERAKLARLRKAAIEAEQVSTARRNRLTELDEKLRKLVRWLEDWYRRCPSKEAPAPVLWDVLREIRALGLDPDQKRETE